MRRSLEILVADDDRDVAESLSEILDMAGHKVHLAFHAEQASELLRRYEFNTVFLNVKLPGMNSIQSFAALRKIKPDGKVVMMTGHTIVQLAAQASAGGVAKVLDAPFTMEAMAEELEDLGPGGILMIDSAAPDFGAALQSALAEHDKRLGIARSAEDPQGILESGGCDVLLLDTRRPVIRDLETYLDLKERGHVVPTVLVGRYARVESTGARAGEDLANTEVFFKPFDPAQVLKLLDGIAEVPPPTVAPQPEAPVPLDESTPPSFEEETEAANDFAGPEPAARESLVLPEKAAGQDLVSELPLATDLAIEESEASDHDIWGSNQNHDCHTRQVESGLSDKERDLAEQPQVPDPVPMDEPWEAERDFSERLAEPAMAGEEQPAETPDVFESAPPFVDDLPAHGFSQRPLEAPEAAGVQEPDAVSDIEEPEPVWDLPSEREAESVAVSEHTHSAEGEEPEEQAPPLEADPAQQETELAAPVGDTCQGGAEPSEPEPARPELAAEHRPAGQAVSPAGKGSAPGEQTKLGATSGETGVLVVDDDEDMAEGLAEVLQDCGLAVKVAHTREEAEEAIETFDAQIALVDIQLGKNSGLELIASLKERCPDLIVVMVTAKTDQQSAVTALRQGAFDYLNKPLHPHELLTSLDRCFGELRKRTEAAAKARGTQAGLGDFDDTASEFLSKLSHQLRTPLNAVVGFSEILSEQMLGPLGSTQYLDYAQDINEAGKLLMTVIEDFAGIDKSATGKVELNEEQVDLARVIFHCLDLIQPAVDAGELTVEIELAEIPLLLRGDRHKLTQVMLSLMTNAVKFTPKQGKIHFTQGRDSSGAIVIEVKDNGIGIAEEVISQALSSVIESDGDLDPDYEGGGLGLPLVTSMVELHGGELALDSEVGVGTTATLRLPAERGIAVKRRAAV
jgi:DNA-binding NtrC family response regulator